MKMPMLLREALLRRMAMIIKPPARARINRIRKRVMRPFDEAARVSEQAGGRALALRRPGRDLRDQSFAGFYHPLIHRFYRDCHGFSQLIRRAAWFGFALNFSRISQPALDACQ